jgi:hypothetical protein
MIVTKDKQTHAKWSSLTKGEDWVHAKMIILLFEVLTTMTAKITDLLLWCHVVLLGRLQFLMLKTERVDPPGNFAPVYAAVLFLSQHTVQLSANVLRSAYCMAESSLLYWLQALYHSQSETEYSLFGTSDRGRRRRKEKGEEEGHEKKQINVSVQTKVEEELISKAQKIQIVPQREHSVLPLERSIGERCVRT